MPGVRDRLGLTVEQTDAAAWTVGDTADGTTVRAGGPRSVALHLAVAWQRSFPLWPFRVPGVGRLLDAVYRLIARNRGRLPGATPWCVAHPDACEPPPR